MDASLFAGSIIILLFSIIIHEVAHGLAALYYGDTTAQRMGRLTLNPIPHIDPIGSILLPAIGLMFGGVIFGWAKPVPTNPLNYRNMRQGELAVSLAGVASNLAIAIVAAILFHLLGNSFFYPVFSNLMTTAVSLNLLLFVFNLIPIPPLDGSKVLMVFLPSHLEIAYRKLEQYGFAVLILLFFTPLGLPIKLIMFGVINLLRGLLGI